ncbi:MAG: DUF3027 domain-containing protein [Actinomycetes bacterium]
MTLISGKSAVLDPACAEAVDVARAGLDDLAPEGTVGEHLGAEPESERAVIHYFASDLPGYRGWRWAVTVMRASRSKTVTIGESVLLPGAETLLPPVWVPWTERLRPGDLGVGDLLPTDEDDPRLEPGWNATDVVTAMDDELLTASESEPDDSDASHDSVGAFHADADDDARDTIASNSVLDDVELLDDLEHLDDADDAEDAEDAVHIDQLDQMHSMAEHDIVGGQELEAFRVAVELDLLRSRVLSPIGLDDAVDRWTAGDHGPDAAMAQGAPATCATCGFRIALRGRLGAAFGVCANEISPSDGHVVTLDHGCGAHSEAVVIPAMAERPEPFVDEVGYEVVAREDPVDDSSEPAEG